MKTLTVEVLVPARGTPPRDTRYRSAMRQDEPSFYIEEHSVQVRILDAPDELGERDARSLIETGLRQVRGFGLSAAGTPWSRVMEMFSAEGFEVHLPHVPRRGFLGIGARP